VEKTTFALIPKEAPKDQPLDMNKLRYLQVSALREKQAATPGSDGVGTRVTLTQEELQHAGDSTKKSQIISYANLSKALKNCDVTSRGAKNKKALARTTDSAPLPSTKMKIWTEQYDVETVGKASVAAVRTTSEDSPHTSYGALEETTHNTGYVFAGLPVRGLQTNCSLHIHGLFDLST
ncbi:unnamed protein product, partial [Amoebophrya sp. A120]